MPTKPIGLGVANYYDQDADHPNSGPCAGQMCASMQRLWTVLAFLPLCTLSSSEPRVQPGAPMLRRGPSLPAAGAGLRGGGGDPASPDVGMANWASDYDRICWNESDPDIKSPLFVPKGTWTEEDFARVRKDPAFQDETSQLLIEREYRRVGLES